MKYIILAYSNDKTFDIPRQLLEVNGEKIVARTIRLLKENGVNDIVITAKDKRFNKLGIEVYEPTNSDYDYKTGKGYWLNAFPTELMDQPICFVWGDVYFSENAIKTIVETETDSALFFCTYNNEDKRYFKPHDEPLAYKVVDYKLFKKHIARVKKLYDKGKTIRHPIVWELYRSINSQNVNEHIMTNNYVAINDYSCDIDSKEDIEMLKERLEMIKCEVIKEFTLAKFDELKNIERKAIETYGKLYVGDKFECNKEMCDYLLGDNKMHQAFIKVIEVIPEKVAESIKEEKPKKKKKK